MSELCPLTHYFLEHQVEDAPLASPLANYVPAIRVGNLLYISGQGPINHSGSAITGQLGRQIDTATGYDAAGLCAVNILKVARQELGSCAKLARTVQISGFVNATDDFSQHPEVINGASDRLVEILGDVGIHSRIAVGVSSLPRNWAVEISAIFEIKT